MESKHQYCGLLGGPPEPVTAWRTRTSACIQQHQVFCRCCWPPVVWADDVPHCVGVPWQGLTREYPIVHTLDTRTAAAVEQNITWLQTQQATALLGKHHQQLLSWATSQTKRLCGVLLQVSATEHAHQVATTHLPSAQCHVMSSAVRLKALGCFKNTPSALTHLPFMQHLHGILVGVVPGWKVACTSAQHPVSTATGSNRRVVASAHAGMPQLSLQMQPSV
jgi:hypothetical protein